MKTLAELAIYLRSRARSVSLTQEQLRERAGISRRTLTHVLSGEHDYKVTTLFAVADRLGLEVALVAKGAAAASGEGTFGATEPEIKTGVQLAREKLTSGSDKT